MENERKINMEITVINQQEVLGKDFKVYGDFENPLFLAKDVAEWIGHSDTSKMIRSIDKDEKLTRILFVSGQNRECNFLTEDGLYEVLMQSRKPIAKAFKKEVKKILKSLRKGENTLIDTNALVEMEAKARCERATAMRMNAENRRLKLLLSNPNWKGLSDVALQTMGIKAVEAVTGQNLGGALPKCEKTYSATEVCGFFSNVITPQKLGSLAKANNVKTDDYGIWVMDKSRYSSKEVKAFRYNAAGVKKLAGLIGVSNYIISD